MKTLFIGLGFLLSVFLLLPGFAFGQSVNPGCVLSWDAPMVEDLPDNPGQMVSQWAKAGDHKGFVFVTRTDALHDWDKLLEQPIDDPTLLQTDCPTIGVEALGQYSVGVRVRDLSLNDSEEAWITFSLVAQDNNPLMGIPELCFNGIHLGQPVKVCQRPGTP